MSENGLGGFLILADERATRLAWHHSVEFDDSIHVTACGRQIDPDDVRDVETGDPTEDWSRNVKPRDSCATCYDSVHRRGLFENESDAVTIEEVQP